MPSRNRPSIVVTNLEEGKLKRTEITVLSSEVTEINDAAIDDIVRILNDHGIRVVVKKTEEQLFVPNERSKANPTHNQSDAFLATAQAVEERKAS